VRRHNLDVDCWHLRTFGVQSSNPPQCRSSAISKAPRGQKLITRESRAGNFHEDSRSSLSPRRPPHLSTLRPSYASSKALHSVISPSPPSLALRSRPSKCIFRYHQHLLGSILSMIITHYFGLYFQNPNGIRVPRVQVQPEETLRTIQNILKRRYDSNRIMKEREKKMLSGEDYQLIEVDLKQLRS
jgi:hypothetical protein